MKKIFLENGDVATTLEKFPRARDKGAPYLRKRGRRNEPESDERITPESAKITE